MRLLLRAAHDDAEPAIAFIGVDAQAGDPATVLEEHAHECPATVTVNDDPGHHLTHAAGTGHAAVNTGDLVQLWTPALGDPRRRVPSSEPLGQLNPYRGGVGAFQRLNHPTSHLNDVSSHLGSLRHRPRAGQGSSTGRGQSVIDRERRLTKDRQLVLRRACPGRGKRRLRASIVFDGVMADSRFAGSDVVVPASVHSLARGAAVEPVWVSGDDGVTFRIKGPSERFVKWRPEGAIDSLEEEAQRLRWARPFVQVPEVLESGSDASGSWLVTAALLGESAISQRWKADAETAVRVAGSALRRLHDDLPVSDCPFEWSIESRRQGVHPSKVGDPKIAETAPPVDKLVVCHGDACVPNTLIASDGVFVGHVDFGDLGVADRWADLAVATWSTEWNYGPGWEGLYLEAYGIDPDLERVRFYRNLWDLVHPV